MQERRADGERPPSAAPAARLRPVTLPLRSAQFLREAIRFMGSPANSAPRLIAGVLRPTSAESILMKFPGTPFSVTDWSRIPVVGHPGERGSAFWKTTHIGDVRICRIE
jgi:hypothetical protein